MVKALLVIAPKFRDEELFHTKEELEYAGVETIIASKSIGVITGMLGGTAQAEKILSGVNTNDYDVIVFIGGSGSSIYYNDLDARTLVKRAVDDGKVLAAICIAPGILANAGVMKGKKATIWDGDGAHSVLLTEKGAVYTGESITVDGKIITANGPSAAHDFGKRIVEVLRCFDAF